MNELLQIEKKIKELIQKKEQLRLKAANDLYKKLENLLGDDFSPEIVLGIISQQWSQAADAQKQQWQEQATVISGQLVKQNPKNQSADQPPATTSLQNKTTHAA